MPERIATAGLGEWELARRQATEYDPALAATTDPFAKPHYEQRHWHLHRNGRFDVVGRSPLDPAPDGGAQAARVRQFSPYGRPIGEALVDPATGAAAPVGDALTPAEIDAHPANIFSRRRIWERGLTGKPWDPELGLYWFGYRWYAPTLRRWTQQEPLGLDGPNLYHYGFGNPSNGFDRDGLEWGGLMGGGLQFALRSLGVPQDVLLALHDGWGDYIRGGQLPGQKYPDIVPWYSPYELLDWQIRDDPSWTLTLQRSEDIQREFALVLETIHKRSQGPPIGIQCTVHQIEVYDIIANLNLTHWEARHITVTYWIFLHRFVILVPRSNYFFVPSDHPDNIAIDTYRTAGRYAGLNGFAVWRQGDVNSRYGVVRYGNLSEFRLWDTPLFATLRAHPYDTSQSTPRPQRY